MGRVGNSLKDWEWEHFEHIVSQIEKLHRSLEFLQGEQATPDAMVQIKWVDKELKTLMAKEKIVGTNVMSYLAQRWRKKHKFFHRTTIGRKNQNIFTELWTPLEVGMKMREQLKQFLQTISSVKWGVI